jgi:hypothetical protein
VAKNRVHLDVQVGGGRSEPWAAHADPPFCSPVSM